MAPILTIWTFLASMVLSVVLGFIWYGPLFGKMWMRLSGISVPDPQPGISTMIKPIILSFVGAIFMTFVLSFSILFHFAYYADHVSSASGIHSALLMASLLWLGFIVPAYLNISGWEGKSWALFFINTGYWLVFMLLAAVLIVSM